MAKKETIEEVIPETPADVVDATEEVIAETPADVVEATEEEETATVGSVTDTLETAKTLVVELLGSDAEHLFQPIEDAVAFKLLQVAGDGSYEGLSNEEAALKQKEEREAEILALQGIANKKLEALYGR